MPADKSPTGWVAWMRKPPAPWHVTAEYYTENAAWKDLRRSLQRCEQRGVLASGCVKPVGERPDRLPQEPADGDDQPA